MELAITTPALLFPAILLLMISYTTRFLHLANSARSLRAPKAGAPESTVLQQIKNIGKRAGRQPRSLLSPPHLCRVELFRYL